LNTKHLLKEHGIDGKNAKICCDWDWGNFKRAFELFGKV
jgi:hypothetical protein